MTNKKTTTEEYTFEVEESDDYGTIEELVKSENHLRIVSQMKDKDRKSFFEAYSYCDSIKIITQGSVGERCFVEYEFSYSYEKDDE